MAFPIFGLQSHKLQRMGLAFRESLQETKRRKRQKRREISQNEVRKAMLY